ncbi:MAG: polysulfide reductase NrfD [Planctomycetota bacterium]|nr:polysulfide reductase NrfD [Planctomycetota bacterium]
MTFLRFIVGAVRLIAKGNKAYYAWCLFLLALICVGAYAYLKEYLSGQSEANMSDSVSWGFFIGNYTFLVGVAAAAIMLVIPAYIYHWQPIKEIVILGELLAVCAMIMVFGFVMVDLGHPERFWHMLPGLGTLNWPYAVLSWGIMAMNAYLILNAVIVTYMLYKAYMDRAPNQKLLWPLVIISIPFAVSIHTVTACIYSGMVARPYWNAAVLAPRFLASAFCSGPAVLTILLQILKRTTRLKIQDAAIWKIAELMAYAMAVNLFLTGVEAFKEFYAGGQHAVFTRYYFVGLGEHTALVPYAWLAVACDFVAFLLLLIPATRRNAVTLNLGCLLIYAGTYIEKGMGLLIPGFTPDALGEIRDYTPSMSELMIAAGVFSLGFLLYTVSLKVAVPVMLGEFKHGQHK